MAELRFGPGDSVDFGTTEAVTANTATLDGSLLSNVAVGDLIVALIHCQPSSANPVSVSSPAWVRVGPAFDGGGGRQTTLYYYAVDSAAKRTALLTGTFTWTFAVTGRTSCTAARALGIDLAAPIDIAAAAFSTTTVSAATFALASITPTSPTPLLVAIVHRQNGSPNNPPLTSIGTMAFHERRSSPTVPATISTTGTAVAWEMLTAAGPTGARTVTYPQAVTNGGGFLVAFKTGTFTPPTPEDPGVPVGRVTAPGVVATSRLHLATTTAGQLVTPTEVRAIPRGYPSVTAMLARQPFYMSHRGGSAAWPEMSLHAYTQSAVWGVGCLEVSVARTLDGVFIGMHDATLDRTSGVTGVTASALTWAQVQQYQISAALPGGQTAKPYMRLEEVFAAYYRTHVMFIDPKSLNAAGRTALLDFMDAAGPDATQRLVWKFYGVSNFAGPAAARGYNTWGYFYDTDLPVLAANQGPWSILGMNHDADQAAWDTIKAYGKPVIGHIVGTAAQAASALAKGAAGLQVSHPPLVVPRT